MLERWDSAIMFLQNIGFPELLVVLIILLLLFGAARLPQIAKSLGKSLGEFKKGMREGREELEDLSKEKEEKKS
jgi:sec-independent protein translocase protein TatA